MKILAVADAVDPALYDHFDRDRWRDVDLVISCGDLPAEYLEFLVTMLQVPVFYVRGNHDLSYARNPPGGCEDIDNRVVRYQGLTLAGAQGSAFYGGTDLQYTEKAMARKLWWLGLRMWRAGGIDILVTHSAPRLCPRDDCPREAGRGRACPLTPEKKCSEASDVAHRGFRSLAALVLRYQPRYLLHGHTHLGYGGGPQRSWWLGQTQVIDCYGRYVLDLT